MNPIPLEGPGAEPVTLAELKAYLRLDGDEEDALLASLGKAARLLVEAHAGRITTIQTWRLVLDAWPCGGVLRVPLAPLRAILAARLIDADGGAAPLASDALVLDAASEPARIRVKDGTPAPGSPLNGIEIDVSVGYGPAPGDVPEPLREAIRALAARWFEQRGEAHLQEPPRLPPEIAALVGPYRRVRL